MRHLKLIFLSFFLGFLGFSSYVNVRDFPFYFGENGVQVTNFTSSMSLGVLLKIWSHVFVHVN